MIKNKRWINPVARTYARIFGAAPPGQVQNTRSRTNVQGILCYGVNPERFFKFAIRNPQFAIGVARCSALPAPCSLALCKIRNPQSEIRNCLCFMLQAPSFLAPRSLLRALLLFAKSVIHFALSPLPLAIFKSAIRNPKFAIGVAPCSLLQAPSFLAPRSQLRALCSQLPAPRSMLSLAPSSTLRALLLFAKFAIRNPKFAILLLAVSISLCYSGFAYSQVSKVHPAISSAALGFRWGELRIHPAFSLTEQYESNVFQTPSNEQGDFSTRISPGFALDLPAGRHDFFGGYRAEFVKYVKLKNQDTINHFATLGMKLDYPSGLTVNMDNVFSKSTEAPLTDTTGPVKNLQDVLGTSVEYRLAERYSIALSHQLYYINYLQQSNEFLDRVENRVGLTGFYRIFPKTDVLFEPGYGRIEYLQSSSTNRNANNYGVLVGVRGEPTARMRGIAKVGYLFRDPQEVGGKSFSGVVTSNQWDYQITGKTNLTLTLERRPFESSFVNNVFFTSIFGILTANYIFSPNLSFQANLGAAYNQYPVTATVGTQTAKRNDTLFGAGAGVTYTFNRWFFVRAHYQFDRRNSNFGIFDFNDNRASISINLAL